MTKENVIFNRVLIIYVILILLAFSTFPIWQHTVNQWPYIGFNIKTDQDLFIVNRVDPEGPAAEVLQPDDIMLTFAGIEMDHDIAKRGRWFWNALKNGSLQAGREVQLVIERQGEQIINMITPSKLAVVYSSKIDEIVLFLLLSLVGIFLLVRIKSRTATVLALCILALATFYSDTYAPRSMLSWLDLVRLVVFQAGLFYSPLLLHFALIHPQKKGIVEKSKIIIPLMYAPWILFYLYGFFKQLYICFFNAGQVRYWIIPLEPYSQARIILRFVVALTIIGLVLLSYFKSRSGSDKQPATLMLIAVLCGLVPVIIIEFLQVFTNILAAGSTLQSVALIIDKLFIFGVAVCFAWSVWLFEKQKQ